MLFRSIPGMNSVYTAALQNRPEFLSYHTVSAYLQGEYGESGIYIGIPCVVNRMGIQRIVELPLGGEEKQRLHSSCEMLENTYQEI